MRVVLALDSASAKVENAGVRVTEIVESDRDFVPVFDPTHPDANEDGYFVQRCSTLPF